MKRTPRSRVLVVVAGDTVAVVAVVPVESAIAGKRLTHIKTPKGSPAQTFRICASMA